MVIWVQAVGDKHHPGQPWSLEELEQIPHLHSLARAIRNAIGGTHKYLSDVKLQNEQEFENFISWVNNNLILRLLVNHQYYDLLELFKDPVDKARWVYLINEIRMEERAHHLKQQALIAPIKITISNPTLYSISSQAMFIWTHPDLNLPPMKQWQHYERELQRLTFEYHVQRAHVRNELLQADIVYIHNVQRILERDPAKNASSMQQLQAVKKIAQRIEEVMDAPIYKPAASIDVNAAASQEDTLKGIQKEIQEILEVIEGLEKEPEIQEESAKHAEVTSKSEKQLEALAEAFHEQHTQLSLLKNETRLTSKAELSEHLSACIQTLEKLEDPKNKAEQTQLIERLKQFTRDLNTVDDFEQVQQIIQQCHDALQAYPSHIPEYQDFISKIIKMIVEKEAPSAPEEKKLTPSIPIAEDKHRFGFSSDEQKQLKERVHAVRKESDEVPPDLENRQEHPLLEACAKLTDVWDNFKNINQFVGEDKSLIDETDRLVKEIKGNVYQNLNETNLNSLVENLSCLEGNYKSINSVLKNIGLAIDFLQNNSKHIDNSVTFGTSP